jgi:hypothetical protein
LASVLRAPAPRGADRGRFRQHVPHTRRYLTCTRVTFSLSRTLTLSLSLSLLHSFFRISLYSLCVLRLIRSTGVSHLRADENSVPVRLDSRREEQVAQRTTAARGCQRVHCESLLYANLQLGNMYIFFPPASLHCISSRGCTDVYSVIRCHIQPHSVRLQKHSILQRQTAFHARTHAHYL